MKDQSRIILGGILVIGVYVTVVGIWVLNGVVFRIIEGSSSPKWYTFKLIEYAIKFLYFAIMGFMFATVIRTHVIPILAVMSVAIAVISYYPFVSILPTNWMHVWVLSPNLMVIPVFIMLGFLKEMSHRAA